MQVSILILTCAVIVYYIVVGGNFNFPSGLASLTHILSYIIEGRVCYLTMCDRAYPKKLAFQYLEDLKNEFERGYANQIETAARPYAFIKFGKFYFFCFSFTNN